MVIVIRTGLIRGNKVNTSVAAASVFYETLTMMSVGAFLAAGILAFNLHEQTVLFWGAVDLMIIAGLPLVPPVLNFFVQIVGIGKLDKDVSANLSKPGYGTLLVGWVCMIISWILMAASLWATFRPLGIDDISILQDGPEFIAASSLFMVAGFLSLIPAGLGVRDLVLVELIAKLFAISDATATLAFAMLRLIWLVSDLIISGILYLWKIADDRKGA